MPWHDNGATLEPCPRCGALLVWKVVVGHRLRLACPVRGCGRVAGETGRGGVKFVTPYATMRDLGLEP